MSTCDVASKNKLEFKRLPTSYSPELYDIKIIPNTCDFTFYGEAKIKFKVSKFEYIYSFR